MLNIKVIRQQLEEAGLGIHSIESEPQIFNRRPDFRVRVDIDGREIDLIIEVKERPHLVDLRMAAELFSQSVGVNQIPIVASHFMGPNRRAMLKEMGVGYIDMAGNIYIRAPGIFIEREGRSNPFVSNREGLNPFSDKASIILRILLDEPNRFWGIREIANLGGINPGWVSVVVDNLVERGLVDFNREKGVSLLRGEDLIKEWSDIYDWRRNKFQYYYCHALNIQELLGRISNINLESDKSIALGFQAGAYLLSPYATFNQIHLIIDGHSFDTIRPEIERQLELEPKKEGANIILVRPYYKYSALFGARRIDKWNVVSDIQLYLDLNKYPLRGTEQAEHLFEKVIRPKFRRKIKG